MLENNLLGTICKYDIFHYKNNNKMPIKLQEGDKKG